MTIRGLVHVRFGSWLCENCGHRRAVSALRIVQPEGRAVQWPLLRDFSDQLSRSRVEARLLLFFG